MPPITTITKNSVFGISISFALVIGLGIWTLATKWTQTNNTLADIQAEQLSAKKSMQDLEKSMGYRWSYTMAREMWRDFSHSNPDLTIPDIGTIRDSHLKHQ